MSIQHKENKINILIVEDQKIMRQVIEDAISQNEKYNIFASIENASFAELYCANDKVDLIIMDVYTSQRENGIEYSKKIKKYYPNIKIIITTSIPEYSFIKKAKECGCESFWYKDSNTDELLDIISRTLSGENVYPDNTPQLDIGIAKSTDFTEEELEILNELVNGCSQQEICEDLQIEKTKLNYYISNILSKTGYDNKVELIIDITDKKFIIPRF